MTLRFTCKGFDYPAFINGSYENNDSLSGLVDTNANSVSLSLEYGIDREYGIDTGNSKIARPSPAGRCTALHRRASRHALQSDRSE